MEKFNIVYVTSSSFKRKENEAFVEYCTLGTEHWFVTNLNSKYVPFRSRKSLRSK